MVVGLCAAGGERPRRHGMSARQHFECAPVEEEAAQEKEGRRGATAAGGHGGRTRVGG
jgi:hypothetical protein